MSEASINENVVVNDGESVVESISTIELEQIKTLRANAVQLTAVAELAYSKARTAELEAQNIILQILNKYKLSISDGENINENGEILRKKA